MSKGALVVRAVLLAGSVTVMAGLGYGQTAAVQAQINRPRAPMWGWPYDLTVMPYWGYWYSPCYPFASCAAYQQFQILERRRERWEELRRGQQPPASVGIQSRGGFPTPQTDEAQIQPEYIRSGQIRDQYQGSGDVLPEFLDSQLRHSR